MLSFYFSSTTRIRQFKHGPLAEHIEALAAEFQRSNYSRDTVRRSLSIIGQFNNYLRLLGLPVTDIDEVVTSKFLDDAFISGASVAMRHLLDYLRRSGIIEDLPARTPQPFHKILDGYDVYLKDVRGLSLSTRRVGRTSARRLADWLQNRYFDEAFTRLSGPDVLEFISERVSQYKSRSSRAHVCSYTRSFLRYLHASGVLATDLTMVVPRVSTPRLAKLPRALPWEQVQALIDAIDTTHPDGLRDKAMFLLLAVLGLRCGELQSIEFDHIDWHAAELRIPRTKSRRERILPLVHEVGSAIADYVLHGRPAVEVAQIFLRHGPRPGPLKTSNTAMYIVRRHLQRAGLHRRGVGAHSLRHSLATRLVNTGVPIKTVADVLGHVSIDTTAIYTKVDVTTLADVALPFPGGA